MSTKNPQSIKINEIIFNNILFTLDTPYTGCSSEISEVQLLGEINNGYKVFAVCEKTKKYDFIDTVKMLKDRLDSILLLMFNIGPQEGMPWMPSSDHGVVIILDLSTKIGHITSVKKQLSDFAK